MYQRENETSKQLKPINVKIDDVDAEWKLFIQSQQSGFHQSIHYNQNNQNNQNKQNIPKVCIPIILSEEQEQENGNTKEINKTEQPVCEELYISTKTKVIFLNQPIDVHNIFWNIPIVEYWKPVTGIIKKQIKLVSKTPEEYLESHRRLQKEYYYTENIIKQIDNPTARRLKFKDERKITVGMSKKDIMNTRIKVKNAFYNCFALVMRFDDNGCFKEIHVKIFNTGKIEIPGIINGNIMERVQQMVMELLLPFMETDLQKSLSFTVNEKDDNILINSNFNCGFFINREKIHAILRSDKYGIESAYDPCSYPGVKCKYYYNNDLPCDHESQTGKVIETDCDMKMTELNDNKKYTEVSFMIFRTGSCLIVGNCSEKVLRFVFTFLKKVLDTEYESIVMENEISDTKGRIKKQKRKLISFTNSENVV
jgi:hypothetical protein